MEKKEDAKVKAGFWHKPLNHASLKNSKKKKR